MGIKPLVLWSAAAVLAVAASSAAVSAATSGTGHDVLDRSDVARELAGAGPNVSLSPLPSASASGATGQAIDTPGGLVVVNCAATGPVLVRWTPKSGYRLGHTVDGPGQTSIVFETSNDRDVIAVIRCVDGQARASFAIGDDDHGGGDDGHGGTSGPH